MQMKDYPHAARKAKSGISRSLPRDRIRAKNKNITKKKPIFILGGNFDIGAAARNRLRGRQRDLRDYARKSRDYTRVFVCNRTGTCDV